jgi:hypothetical protein
MNSIDRVTWTAPFPSLATSNSLRRSDHFSWCSPCRVSWFLGSNRRTWLVPRDRSTDRNEQRSDTTR